MKHRHNSEAGFSLIAVLIVMGVVLFSMLLISQAKFRAQGTQKAIKVKQSYADINQALINNVVDVFHNNMSSTCNSLVGSKLNTPKPLDGAVTYVFEKEVKVSGLAGTTTPPPSPHTQAQTRCKTPVSPANGNSTNRFYFCVELKTDPAAPKDSILSANTAFAEFAIELIDLQTQLPITCSDYETRSKDKDAVTGTLRDGSAGMAVTMALYWANKSGGDNKFVHSQKALSYIANQN
ncbi:MAG: type II secretion system protein [Bdellovibrionota bacterium]